MTLPLEQSMERERAKPVEEMARAICVAIGDDWNREGVEGLRSAYEPLAKAALACLVSHGFITIEGLLAMKAEQEAKPSDTAQTDTRKP